MGKKITARKSTIWKLSQTAMLFCALLGGKMQAVEKSQGLEASQASPFSKKASDAAKIVHQIIDRAISPLCDSGFLAANGRFYNSFENLRKLASHTNTSEAFKSFLIEKMV
jgi:hypothetical protein